MDITLTSFGGPGAPCTLLQSDALDLRVVLDCGATPVAASPPSLRAPDVRALVAAAPASRRLDPCPFADAVLLTSPAAVLALPLLYRAALEASDAGGSSSSRAAAAAASSAAPPPLLPLHTYATEACLEIAEHWIAELLDAAERGGPAAGQANGGGGGAPSSLAAAAAGAAPNQTTTIPTTTPLFSARDARGALACVRPVRLGERLALPGGGRVVAEALPASGARLGVCAWRLSAGATERLVYLGPCASLLRGHAAPFDLRRTLGGARAVILGPGAVAGEAEGAAARRDEEKEEEDEEAARLALFAEGRPRPPLLEQSLRGGANPADARHAVAVHRAARAALDAMKASVAAADAAAAAAAAAANGAASGAAGDGAAAANAAGRAASAAVVVAVDPTGAAFDFLEALEHEARLAGGQGQLHQQQQQRKEEEEEESEEEEEEEEGELERPAAATGAAAAAPPAPTVRVCYAGPAAEGSLALAASAAEFLSPGRLSRVVRRAAAPFAHCRMMRGAGEEEGEGGAGGSRRHAQQQQRPQERPGPPVRLRVGDGHQGADVAIVPAARFLRPAAAPAAAAAAADDGQLIILLGTAAAASAAASAPPGHSGRVLRIPLPGERGLDPAALLAAFEEDPASVVVAAASQREADALTQAAAAALGGGAAAAASSSSSAAAVVVAYGRAPVALPPLPAPLYEAWLSGSLAARVALSPLALPAGEGEGEEAGAGRSAGAAATAAAARLPPVRLSGGGGAWTVEEEEGGADRQAVVAEAVVVSALRAAGFEVTERRREEEEEEEEEDDEGAAAAVVVALAVAGAQVRLAFSAAAARASTGPSRLRSVLVLSDDAPLRERLRGLCEGALREGARAAV